MLNEEKAVKFYQLLEKVKDTRDRRGKRHNLSFIITSTILAILSGRTFMSSIHRYITNHIEWLKEILERPEAFAVSRSQLPRILASVDFDELNQYIEEFFGIHIERHEGEWQAIDGKTLRGTITDKRNSAHENEKIVTVVGHKSEQTTHQRPINYGESSEIIVVRELLEETDLSSQKITLDSLHTQVNTLSVINSDDGQYIVQVKKNQPRLINVLESVSQTHLPLHTITTREKNHGRLEVRRATFFSLENVIFDDKWEDCGFKTLIYMERDRVELKTGEYSEGQYYYLSNQESDGRERELFTAIREHWQVEVNNHIRDVTLKEDDAKTKNKNLGQIYSLLRTVALNIIKEIAPGNVVKAMDKFSDKPHFFISRLVKFNFF